jgi:hypothetical protein
VRTKGVETCIYIFCCTYHCCKIYFTNFTFLLRVLFAMASVEKASSCAISSAVLRVRRATGTRDPTVMTFADPPGAKPPVANRPGANPEPPDADALGATSPGADSPGANPPGADPIDANPPVADACVADPPGADALAHPTGADSTLAHPPVAGTAHPTVAISDPTANAFALALTTGSSI